MSVLRLPGDKSIAHRALLMSCLAGGDSRIAGLPGSRDVMATVNALVSLGVAIRRDGPDEVLLSPPAEWSHSRPEIDCGNSGTTARLLAGLLVGVRCAARLTGDASLRARPMDRVVYPLRAMGGRLSYAGTFDRLPLDVDERTTGSLRVLRYRPRVASAQVKSALLLAAVPGRTELEVHEPARSRDHSERMLHAMGAPLLFGPEAEGARVHFDPSDWDGGLAPLDFDVPGDPSSAAFVVAAALLAGKPLVVEEVCLNPTRTTFLEVLREMGAKVAASIVERRGGEPVGRLEVTPGPLSSFRLTAPRVTEVIDEIPVLAVLAARAEGTSTIEGAGELRVKESDRLSGLARNLEALGARCEEKADGLVIEGSDAPLRGTVVTGGDHRVAMAFAVLGMAPGCRMEIDDPACVDVSFPGFWDVLASLEEPG